MVNRILLAMLLSLGPGCLWAATIEAHVDRNPVAVNESFTLSFDINGDVDGDPNLAPLEALFDVLNRAQSSSVRIINGDMTRTHQWQLTLMARAPGDYEIPPIAFGKEHSQALQLKVLAAAAGTVDQGGPIFLEAELSPKQATVQSQLVYTVRLLREVELNSAELTEPKVTGVETMVQKLGEDRSYSTLRNGVRYLVVERSYALFPQQSGALTVEPTVFTGQIVMGGRFPFGARLQAKRLSTETFHVQVRPLPAAARRPWLPASRLELTETWAQDPPVFRVGEPVTRTLSLTAAGIAAAQLPTLARDLPDGLKNYPDKPVLNDAMGADGVTGTRQEKIAIIPTRPGRYELPGMEIPWWNTQTGQQELARIPPRTIEVTGVAPAPSTPASLPVESKPVAPAEPVAQPVKHSTPGVWPWVSLALTIGWAITVLLWWRRTRRVNAPPSDAGNHNVDLSALRKACKKNDAQACKTELLRWAKDHWRDNPPTSLGGIAARVDADFATALNALNSVLYAPVSAGWNGPALLSTAERWIKSARRQAHSKSSAMAPLHPDRAA